MKINDKMINIIKKYQDNKPLDTPARCVHYPSCSNYAIGCYKKFSFPKATYYTCKRILFCTPLNKKTYDPVPMNKEEKEYDKEANKKAKTIRPVLLEHYQKYPLMQVQDFIKLIYQSTFGPYHFGNIGKDLITSYIIDEMKLVSVKNEIREDIGDNYIRIYLSKETDINLLIDNFYESSSNDTMDDFNKTVFYKRLNILISLINNRKIKLPKKVSIKEIQDYMFNEIKPVRHSDIYNKEYQPHYRVIKKL